MKTPALRRRVTALTLAILTMAFVAFGVAVTISYRDGLIGDLRTHLTSGAAALDAATGVRQREPLINSLALEGIKVDLATAPTPSKRGLHTPAAPQKPPLIQSQGSLLVLHQLLGRSQPPVMATLSASAANVSAPVNRLIVIELVAAVATLAVATLVLLRGLRAVLAPVAHVGRVASQIATGDRARRLRPRNPRSELGQMAGSFDAMVDAIEEAAEKARASEQAMRRFVADASHELRTPIAALQVSAETLLREQPPRPDRDALEAQLAREAARLGRLTDDLLSLARLESTESPRREPLDLAVMAEATAAEARKRAGGAHITVSTRGDMDLTGDADALARCLRNVLDNALAATNMAGDISIELHRTESAVIMRVTDNGPGVPASERERIFDGFVRLNRNHAGAGLGLAIARRIALQHAGTLSCDETATGASFTLTLPVNRNSSPQTHTLAIASPENLGHDSLA
jgi:signal transduction histidine kinase